MLGRCLFVSLAVLVTARVSAADPTPPQSAELPLERLLWSVTDVVLDQHIDPPARQQMLLVYTRKLLQRQGSKEPADLSRRISAVTTPEQYAALLSEIGAGKPKPDSCEYAMESMLNSLPGRAHFFTPEQVHSAGIVANNNYVGTGIQVRMEPKEKLVQILMAFNGPFRRSGGKTNDLIVEVDGKSMAGLKLSEVVAALRGEDGTPVTMTVRQPGSTETRQIKMVREVIPFVSAVGYRRISEDDYDFRPDSKVPIAHIRLNGLTGSTYHELRRLERQLRSDGNRALVLDLRATDPGQLVHAAQVADAFLDGGLMWKVRDGHDLVTEYKADRDCLFRDWPLVVLVGVTTVETPAVIAASLQDRDRGIVVGEATPAVISLKNLVALPNGGGGVSLTNKWIVRAKPGEMTIKPDHLVNLDVKTREKLQAWLNGRSQPMRTDAAPPEDPQLAKALDVLRNLLKDKQEKIPG